MNALIPVLTKEESQNLFIELKKSSRYPTGKRNRSIILLAYYCGLRVSEIIGHEKRMGGGLRIRDINLTTGEITIRDAKDNRKSRVGMVGRKVFAEGITLDSLREYWEIRSSMAFDSEDLFFVNRLGGKISNREARAMFERYAERAQLPMEKRHMHALRHSCGTGLASSGVPLHVIQKVLGHSSLQTTSIYLHATTDDVQSALKKYQS